MGEQGSVWGLDGVGLGCWWIEDGGSVGCDCISLGCEGMGG
mgnify:CR=1 FL=1